jgi:LuxR family maltose regulon positive regulatory protein
LFYEWNNLDQAAEHLRLGIELCRAWPGFAEETLAGLLNLATVSLAKRDAQETGALVRRAEHLVQTYGLDHWAAQLDLHRANLWLAQGNVAELTVWAANQPDSQAEMPAVLWGRPAETLAQLTPILPQAKDAGRTGSFLSMLLLQASAHYQLRNTDQALTVLSSALSLSEPEGYVRLYIDHGQPMIALLKKALSQAVTPKYARSLLLAFEETETEREGPTIAASTGPVSPALVEPLTSREREVLQLIGAGLSNPEIARELIIAVTTVKTHVQNIYGKLNVSNRFQAIERARELKLI